ncbi:MAG: hypothetical protein PHV59_04820 [Victivallales bacterium]|nr:hypothetical protein [Victivallales bacterium]
MKDDINATREMLKQLENVRIVQVNEPVTAWRQAEDAVQKLKQADIDLLLIQVLTYTMDELTVKIINAINVPLLLWGVPEPLLRGNIKSGGLVGYVQTAGVVSKLDRDYKFLWGNPGYEKLLRDIAISVNVIETIKKLRNSRIGLLGSRCPGMLDEAFHELELTRSIGPEIITLDLTELINIVKAMDCERTKEEITGALKQYGNPDGPTANDLTEALKIYLALRDIAQANSFQAMAVKCWPELMHADIMSPCLAISRLNDEGIMTACEGDVTAAVSMLILYYLTGKQVFLCDLFEMSEADNSYFLYHCGAAAAKLAASGSDVRLAMHFRKYKPLEPMTLKPGVIADFSIKPGKVTFARLTEKQGKYRLLIMQGEAVPQENIIGGNGMRVIMAGKVSTILGKMVKEGIEHHQLLVHADIKAELTELCRCLGLETITIQE